MRYLISDLHLVATPARDTFNAMPGRREALIDLIMEATAPGNELIILGDLFDTWLDPYEAIREAYQDVCELLMFRGRFLILRGNHDDLWPTTTLLSIEAENKRIHLSHGHEFDPVASGWLGHLATWIAGLVMDVVGSPMSSTGETWPQCLTRWVGGGQTPDQHRALAGVAALLAGYDVIVIAHDHELYMDEHVIGTGTWTGAGCPVTLLHDDGTFTQEDWHDHHSKAGV
jgi:predicted phosphodiesterase